MAFADKITTMRRMAIIYKNHNIIWEGVKIESNYLLKRVGKDVIASMPEEEFDEWFTELQRRERPELEVKFQDPEGEKYWEPRKDTEEEVECPDCDGNGGWVTPEGNFKCEKCDGSGKVKKDES